MSKNTSPSRTSAALLTACFAALVASVVTPAAADAAGGPPATEKRPVAETIHGSQFTDDYRWLEGDLSNTDPNHYGALTDEVVEWSDAQNAYTRAVLDNLPGRAELTEKMRMLIDLALVGSPNEESGVYVYVKRDKGQTQPVRMIRSRQGDGTLGPEHVVLDANAIDPEGLTNISWTSLSPDGKLLAFGLSHRGDEDYILFIKDVATGKWLSEEIPGKVTLAMWMPDNRSFVYARRGDEGNPSSREYRLHTIGNHWRQDPVLLSQTRDGKWFYPNISDEELATRTRTWGPWMSISEDARWAVVGHWAGPDVADLWVTDFTKWVSEGMPETPGRVIARDRNGRPGSRRIVGNTLYLETAVDAPAGRVVAIDLLAASVNIDDAKVVVPEEGGAIIDSVSFSRSYMLVTRLVKAKTRIDVYTYNGEFIGQLPLPGIGTAWVTTDADTDEVFLGFTSYSAPRTIYRIADVRQLMEAQSDTPGLYAHMPAPNVPMPTAKTWGDLVAHWDRPDVPVDPSIIDVKQVTYTSKDGTPVTMFVTHKKGLELNGDHPTLLYGYGGFNLSMRPTFSATLVPWLESGGVYAVANIRGGGEYGADWHRGGIRANKQRSYDDFIAAAQYLIKEGYTNPDRLAIQGGSNGGLLTGAVLVQRPELFTAVISAVPLLDMHRFDKFLMGQYWISEFGDPADPEQFAWINAYSPYQNVDDGASYPSTFIIAGEQDARVHPMHARKMAARLQEATSSDVSSEPVLLWVNRDSGHGAGKPIDMIVRDSVDLRLYLMWQTGMLDDTK